MDPIISKVVLRYYGGKWRLAPWIISHFPQHKHYIEPCGGAASVLLQKPRSMSAIETYNDLDGNVVNFFSVLRDRPAELIRKINLTPWARAEYELHYKPAADPVERARRFWVGCWFAISHLPYTSSGMSMDKARLPGKSNALTQLDQKHLEAAAQRLKGVQIENRPYQEVVKDYASDVSLIYFDPPYVPETRAVPDQYALDWNEQDHIQAADLLRQSPGYIIVSGYACELYEDLHEARGWLRKSRKTQTTGSKKVESICLSPRTIGALKQKPLF